MPSFFHFVYRAQFALNPFMAPEWISAMQTFNIVSQSTGKARATASWIKRMWQCGGVYVATSNKEQQWFTPADSKEVQLLYQCLHSWKMMDIGNTFPCLPISHLLINIIRVPQSSSNTPATVNSWFRLLISVTLLPSSLCFGGFYPHLFNLQDKSQRPKEGSGRHWLWCHQIHKKTKTFGKKPTFSFTYPQTVNQDLSLLNQDKFRYTRSCCMNISVNNPILTIPSKRLLIQVTWWWKLQCSLKMPD